VFLDITATIENRGTIVTLVRRLAQEINIPFTVGGGIQSVEDVGTLIEAGADKISINSSAVKRPELITEIAKQFGSQSIVLAIDTNFTDDTWNVFTHGGRTSTNLNTVSWAKKAEEFGAGEILLTSMNNDGTKAGFSIDITAQVSAAVNIPVIASGGAGSKEHFKTVFEKTAATGGLAASIFHYGEIPIPELKTYLKAQKIAVR
jgi:cyclase